MSTSTTMGASSGDYAWVMASSALVFMMLPGIAVFYSGLRSQTTALSLLWLNMMTFSAVTIQWFLVGYSLVFSSSSSSHYIGNLHNSAFLNTMNADSFAGIREGDTPALLFGTFQGMFAAFTLALITGVIAERGRLLPFLIFAIIWTTLVYDPIAYWMWNLNGWGNRLGCLDWAGGTPVHIASGAASLAYTLIMKWIRTNSLETPSGSVSEDHTAIHKGPRIVESKLESHNIPMAYLGFLLVWFGWFGFNAGSELKSNMRAASAFMTTNIAAASGGFSYSLYQQLSGDKWTGVGFCTGAFTGLVSITPGAGYVPMWAGLIFGITAAAICFILLSISKIDYWLEEPLDISIIHGAGGLWGMVLTGVFADNLTAKLDGSIIDGGAINGNAVQIGYQLAGGIAAFAYSFAGTGIILISIHALSLTSFFPSLALRAESRGSDQMRLDCEELGDREAYKIECYYHPISEQEPSPLSLPMPISTQGPTLATPSVPVPVPTHSDWQGDSITGTIPLQNFQLPRIDPHQGSSSEAFMESGRQLDSRPSFQPGTDARKFQSPSYS